MQTEMATDRKRGSSKKKTDWKDVAGASAKAQAKTDKPPPRRFEDNLPCELTDKELLDRGTSLVEEIRTRKDLERKHKQASASFKAQIELTDERIGKLLDALETEQELRDVTCFEEMIYETHSVRVLRGDTREVVSERAMTVDERQPELPLGQPELPLGKASKKSGAKAKADDIEPDEPGDVDA